jgi:DNA primase
MRISATYPYRDEGGNLLFEVVRFEPKAFRQRRPVEGGWEWGLGGTRRVIYRLPEVLEAGARGRQIIIVEGEKDADLLARLGLASTTSPCGAGKWRDEYSRLLAGFDATIVPDSDVAGRRHAHQVAASLCDATRSVRIVELPSGFKDASDFFGPRPCASERRAFSEILDRAEMLSREMMLSWRGQEKTRVGGGVGSSLGIFPSIEEVAGWYTVLSPRNGQLVGLCPLHEEREPSFVVNPEKNAWYCHGCGEGGGVVKLYARVEGKTIDQAARALARDDGRVRIR